MIERVCDAVVVAQFRAATSNHRSKRAPTVPALRWARPAPVASSLTRSRA